MNIRATRIEMKNSIIQTGHLVSPGENFLFPRLLSLSLASETRNLKLAEAYIKLRADQAIPNVILKLERIAQHSETKLQDFLKEMGMSPRLFNLGTEAQRNQDHSNPEHHISSYKRAMSLLVREGH
jgi:hypothetical protein